MNCVLWNWYKIKLWNYINGYLCSYKIFKHYTFKMYNKGYQKFTLTPRDYRSKWFRWKMRQVSASHTRFSACTSPWPHFQSSSGAKTGSCTDQTEFPGHKVPSAVSKHKIIMEIIFRKILKATNFGHVRVEKLGREQLSRPAFVSAPVHHFHVARATLVQRNVGNVWLATAGYCSSHTVPDLVFICTIPTQTMASMSPLRHFNKSPPFPQHKSKTTTSWSLLVSCLILLW